MKIRRPQEVKGFPEARQLTPEELAEVYRMAKAAFTAEDLQKFTELGEGVSLDAFLAELEDLQKQFDQKQQ